MVFILLNPAVLACLLALPAFGGGVSGGDCYAYAPGFRKTYFNDKRHVRIAQKRI